MKNDGHDFSHLLPPKLSGQIHLGASGFNGSALHFPSFLHTFRLSFLASLQTENKKLA